MAKLWDNLFEYEDRWGFQVKKSLNTKIWNKGKLNPKIKSLLMEIAYDFLDEDRDIVKVTDVTITGSLANFNWSKYSDIDLHILANYGSQAGIKKKLFDYKRKMWNKQHDVKIEGFDVEVYVQDHKEPHYSTGVYSVMHDKWLVEPSIKADAFDMRAVVRKANCIADKIDGVKELIDASQFKEAIDTASSIMSRLKKQRSAGLASGGEFSTENLAFKLLRRRGDVERLLELKSEAYDCTKSINKHDCD